MEINFVKGKGVVLFNGQSIAMESCRRFVENEHLRKEFCMC